MSFGTLRGHLGRIIGQYGIGLPDSLSFRADARLTKNSSLGFAGVSQPFLFPQSFPLAPSAVLTAARTRSKEPAELMEARRLPVRWLDRSGPPSFDQSPFLHSIVLAQRRSWSRTRARHSVA